VAKLMILTEKNLKTLILGYNLYPAIGCQCPEAPESASRPSAVSRCHFHKTFFLLHKDLIPSWVGSCPYPQILGCAVKIRQKQKL
jgi:hypothetical protein